MVFDELLSHLLKIGRLAVRIDRCFATLGRSVAVAICSPIARRLIFHILVIQCCMGFWVDNVARLRGLRFACSVLRQNTATAGSDSDGPYRPIMSARDFVVVLCTVHTGQAYENLAACGLSATSESSPEN